MNISDVRTQLTGHGHVGEFRLDWRSEFFQVRTGGAESPIRYFASAKDAEIAAWREMHRIEKTAMVRGGEKLQARSRGDAFYSLPPTPHRKIKIRPTRVTRNGG